MRIFLACPAPPKSRKGNRVTAQRWADILRSLGHQVTIGTRYIASRCDLMIALHALKSRAAMAVYRAGYPKGPLILCLTGTDLYRDMQRSASARIGLEWADRLVLLQEYGKRELEPRLRRKCRVILQSAEPVGGSRKEPRQPGAPLHVVVLGHLRYVKDPFRTALALRCLPKELPIRVTHLGAALDCRMADRARRLMEAEPRYHWQGEVSRSRARKILAGSDLMVLSSRLEGGANVISEALVDDVPVLASRMPGNVGLLGAKHPGYFPVGDTQALARLLRRAATEFTYYHRLANACAERKQLFTAEREREAWRNLLAEMCVF
ncbi:MAG: TIGR04348 family glycosyltransferase [Planctomycetia bacterium]|nr:TIGR04348 family glycosyltransferase [Planctomycetia bacterium]